MKFEDIKVGDKLVNRYTHEPEDVRVTDIGGGSFTVVFLSDNQARQYRASEAERFTLKIDVPAYKGVWPSDPGYKPEPDPLAEHAAVTGHGYGVSSDDLASFVESFASFCQSRIKGTGKEQYDLGNRQAFEDMTEDEMVTGLIEEIADGFNYMAMGLIKVLSATRARQGWR